MFHDVVKLSRSRWPMNNKKTLDESAAEFRAEFEKLPDGPYRNALAETANSVGWVKFYFECHQIDYAAADLLAMAKLIMEVETQRKKDEYVR
jgi:hypothetical protein